LAAMCFDYDASQQNDSIFYMQYRKATYHPDYVNPVERTLTQLKNSGGMRLIRKRAAVDSIIAYDDEAKKLLGQQAAYERYLNNWAELAEQIFNLKYMYLPPKFKINGAGYNDLLLTNDKKIMTRAGNSVVTYYAVVDFYINRLKETEVHSVNLIHTLQKQYDLKDE
jgi:hypothetical protein